MPSVRITIGSAMRAIAVGTAVLAVGHAHAVREEMVIKNSADGVFRPDDKSMGVIIIEPQDRARSIRLRCEALSGRDGKGDAWVRLEISSDISGISFDKTLGIEHASRVVTEQMFGTIPANARRTVRIDHTNQSSAANELSCRVNVD